MKLFQRADGLDVLEVERVAPDVLELAAVLEVHPTRVALRHIDRLFRHVAQIQDARLDNLLRLEHLLLRGLLVVRAALILSTIAIQLDHHAAVLVVLDRLLARRGLGKFLVGLEHLLENEQQAQYLVLAGDGNQNLSLSLEDGLLNLRLQALIADELVVLARSLRQRRRVVQVVLVDRAQPRWKGVRDEDVDVFEVVWLHRWRDLQLLVVQLESVENRLFLKLDFPGRAADRVARRHRADDQVSVLDLQPLVLVE